MKFKNEEAEKNWKKNVALNKGCPYGEPIIIYSKTWAERIESKMEEFPSLDFGMIADQTDRGASIKAGGITGFQYGCAVRLLSDVWIHGETLRRWHNLKTQRGTEGIIANNSGGVLNPALLRVNISQNDNSGGN